MRVSVWIPPHSGSGWTNRPSAAGEGGKGRGVEGWGRGRGGGEGGEYRVVVDSGKWEGRERGEAEKGREGRERGDTVCPVQLVTEICTISAVI